MDATIIRKKIINFNKPYPPFSHDIFISTACGTEIMPITNSSHVNFKTRELFENILEIPFPLMMIDTITMIATINSKRMFPSAGYISPSLAVRTIKYDTMPYIVLWKPRARKRMDSKGRMIWIFSGEGNKRYYTLSRTEAIFPVIDMLVKPESSCST